MKIAIVGNGAIGNVLALGCHMNHFSYELLLRHPAALTLDVTDTDKQRHTLAPQTRGIEQGTDAEVIFLPLKAYQVARAVEQLLPTLKPDQILVLLHNGMGTDADIDTLVDKQPVIIATTSYGAFKPSPDALFVKGKGETRAGWLSGDSRPLTVALQHILDRLLPPCSWCDDVKVALWQKLAVNAVINPLTSIHQVPNGALTEARFSSHIARLCDETAAVMGACGYPASSKALHKQCLKVAAATAENYSSMNRDLAEGRKTEVEYINGYIVDRAGEHNIEVPGHALLLEQILALES